MMKRYILIAIVMVGTVLSGCKTGVVVRNYYKASGPIAQLQFKKGTDINALDPKGMHALSHELLAFDRDGLLVVAEDKLVHVEYNTMLQYRYRGKRRFFSKKQNALAIQAEIKGMYNGGMVYLVRYPQGVSPELMNALLEAYKQEEIIKISSKS